MAKTFNRAPIQVDTPDSSDVKNYFFNHYDWKGLSDSKNMLSVDQETFSECNNVYINSEGLLRSRPSLKVKLVKYTDDKGEIQILANIINIWTFDDVTLYQSTVNDKYYLTFVNKNFDNHVQVELKYVDENDEEISYKEIRPILANKKIFIFSEHDFNYYDVAENIYANAEKFIYVPTTSTNVGIVSTDLESKNILTKSYITKYLYDTYTSTNFDDLVGTNVTIKVEDNTYNVTFVYNNQLVFVSKYTSLSKYNFSDEYLLGENGEGYPLVETSERESMLISSYNYTTDDLEEIQKGMSTQWTIYHTDDGIRFTKLPVKDGVIGMPKISRDGNYAFVFCDDGPYVYSLYATIEDNKVYSVWTNLLETIDKTTYDEWVNAGFHLTDVGDDDTVYPRQTYQVNGYFRDDKLFAFTYSNAKEGDTLFCVYCNGEKLFRRELFYPTKEINMSFLPESKYSSSPVISSEALFKRTSYDKSSRAQTTVSTNLSDTIIVLFDEQNSSTRASATFSNLVLTQEISGATFNSDSNTYTINWGNITLSGNLIIKLSDGTIISEENLSFVRDNYAPIVGNCIGMPDVVTSEPRKHFLYYSTITSTNNISFENKYFTFEICPVTAGTYSLGSYNVVDYSLQLKVTAKNFTINEVIEGFKFYETTKTVTNKVCNYMPNLYVSFYSESYLSIAVSCIVSTKPDGGIKAYHEAVFHIENGKFGEVCELLFSIVFNQISVPGVNTLHLHSPLRDSIMIYNRIYTVAYFNYIHNASVFEQYIAVRTVKLSSSVDANGVFTNESNLVQNAQIDKHSAVQVKYTDEKTYLSEMLRLGDPTPYLLTTENLYDYASYYNDSWKDYNPIKLLFKAVPVANYYSGNSFDSIYLATENALYISNTSNIIEVDKLVEGETNFILPEVDSLLEDYYFAKRNELYVSKSVSNEFKWYFPELRKQSFDDNITNLHPISNSEMAIFFADSVWYSTYDTETTVGNETGVYRYYKSKMQVGCKKGSDVLTTFDGKYTIFTSHRGLVAMSYQDFIASSEQSLTYLSDSIYNTFIAYITNVDSKNEVKLFKFGYWIIIYKQDANNCFVFDIRNNSWWPISIPVTPLKVVTMDDSVKLLCSNQMNELVTTDTDYFDYINKKRANIEWFIKSQKLHLSALNNYKHIVNITLLSVHDSNILQESKYNINESAFKLQVNCYRKKINGNINDVDDYITVNYDVDTLRTFVQRLNYSKINEFQYQLSSDEENIMDIPLSLNSITIKYKIGGQVR